MIHQRVTHVSFEAFQERAHGKKVVLLYPWTSYRNIFLSYFLAGAQDGLLYHRVMAQSTTLRDWLADMLHEFDGVLGGFGDPLKAALGQGTPKDLAQGLAKSLDAYAGQCADGRVVLFLDELDRLIFDDDFKAFGKELAAALPSSAQLVVSARNLSYLPWYPLVQQGDAMVFGTERYKDDLMFTVEHAPKPQLEVYGFGRGHALINGQEVTSWDGALPRNLFFYFVDNPLVTRDDIFETFWPNLSVKEATNVFHVTKRKISERISAQVELGGEYELTQYSSGFYMPSSSVVRHYDVEDFQEAVERAMIITDPHEEERLYRFAVNLYRAPFLETVKMEWARERRRHLRTLYAQALIGLGRIERDDNQIREAFGHFNRALKETPDREDIHQEVIKLYLSMGMPDDARQQYRQLESILGRNNAAPSNESRALYSKIS